MYVSARVMDKFAIFSDVSTLKTSQVPLEFMKVFLPSPEDQKVTYMMDSNFVENDLKILSISQSCF